MQEMLVLGMPDWLFWLLASFVLLYSMILSGLVLGKMGVNPMWGILLTLAILLPVWELPLLALTFGVLLPFFAWRLAYCRWPRLDNANSENQSVRAERRGA